MTLKATQKIRKLLNSQQVVVAPGVFDGLSARLVERAGFSAIYASGGAIARSSGFPDIGLLSFDEISVRLRQIIEVTQLPLIADADTGFGNEANVQRVFRQLEQIGVAGAHLEDQAFPKRCGHLNDKQLISRDEMLIKIKAARHALSDPDFLLIARTDAIAVEGFAAAIARAKAYLDAGADMIFIEAPESLEQVKQIAREIPQPKLINMFHGGKTPLIPVTELQNLGYSIIIIPSDLQRAAIHAMQETLNTIREHGDSASIADQLTSFNDRELIVRTHDYLNITKQLSKK